MNNIFRNPKLDTEKHPTRHYSSAQEESVEKAIGGRRTSNSGATMFQKGDVLTNKVLIECKTTTKSQKSFTLKKEWFEKNKQESLFMGKEYSAVVFSFGPGEENYYIIDETMFKEFLDYISEEHSQSE